MQGLETLNLVLNYRSHGKRGGVQCGAHVVLALIELIIGAGTICTFDERDDHRFETIRYLINTVKRHNWR